MIDVKNSDNIIHSENPPVGSQYQVHEIASQVALDVRFFKDDLPVADAGIGMVFGILQ